MIIFGALSIVVSILTLMTGVIAFAIIRKHFGEFASRYKSLLLAGVVSLICMSAVDTLKLLMMYGGLSIIMGPPLSAYVFMTAFFLSVILGLIAYGSLFAGLYLLWRKRKVGKEVGRQ